MPQGGIAILGAGMIGAAHASGYRMHLPRFAGREPAFHLLRVCDTREEVARSLADTYGFAETGTDWRAAIDDDRIGIVSVALPNFVHAEAVSAALRAGKHVLCEKPLALSAVEARRLAGEAEAAGVTAGTVFNYRRLPAVAEVQRLVAAGEVGTPVQLLVQYQAEYAADPDLPHSWRYEKDKAGGGALLDVGTHAIDAARFVCGDIAEVVGAAASTVIPRRFLPARATSGHGHVALSTESRPVDTDDAVSATLLFQNGCLGLFSASRVAVGMGNTLSLTLHGTEGTVSYSSAAPGEYRIARRRGAQAGLFVTVPNRPASPYAGALLPVPHDGVAVGYAEAFGFMIADFLTAVAEGRPMTNGSLEDGLKAAEGLEAIQRSVALRRPVAIAEITQTLTSERNAP